MAARDKPRDPTLYRVIVADNYHYQDPDEEYVLGDFTTEEEAVAACRRIVEESLQEHLAPGVTAGGLFNAYTMFGEDPYVVSPRDATDRCTFSAWDYARTRCEQLAAEAGRV